MEKSVKSVKPVLSEVEVSVYKKSLFPDPELALKEAVVPKAFWNKSKGATTFGTVNTKPVTFIRYRG